MITPEKPDYKYGDIVVVAEGDPEIEYATEGDFRFPQPERKYRVLIVKLNPDKDGYWTNVVDICSGRRYQDFDSDWFVKYMEDECNGKEDTTKEENTKEPST